jgi:hypothetical protein
MEPDRAKKLAAVIFLTLLIWVWAYFALEEDTAEWGTLNISKDIPPNLLVTFVGEREPPIPVRLTLTGPNSKIAELRRRLRGDSPNSKKISLDFYYNPQEEEQTEPGTHIWNVLAFLKNSDQIKGLGLNVADCDRKTIKIETKGLVEKPLTIHCVDERGLVLKHEDIHPTTVPMFVPQDWDGPANVVLTKPQIERAREAPVQQKPYIILNSKPIYADTPVTVKLPASREALNSATFQPIRIKYVVSGEIVGKYKLNLLNEAELTSSTQFRATESALSAYEKQPYHLLIDISESEVLQSIENGTDRVVVEVIYNFPDEYIRRNEIELSEPVRQARIEVIPLASQGTE